MAGTDDGTTRDRGSGKGGAGGKGGERSGWDVAGRQGPRGAYARRPNRVLVPRAEWERRAGDVDERLAARLGGRLQEVGGDEVRVRSVVALEGAADVERSIAALRAEGIAARPDHVFFAVDGGSVSGAPVMFGGVHGSPVMFGGVGGAPVMFGAVGGGCGCCCTSPTLPAAPPTPRSSTVCRADAPADADPDPPKGVAGCRVVVVDTGLAVDGLRPAALAGVAAAGDADLPDADGDDQLDAATGHATFIAGIVRRLAPGATVAVRQVLSTFGDASDWEVANALLALLDGGPAHRPDVVNLSFAGYADDDTTPPGIAEAIAALVAEGVVVVAAAGNDGTCRPAYPAATPGVIGVGALDGDGPAWFTNHGPWVRACAPGVDVVSCFFDYAAADGSDPALRRPSSGPGADRQPDETGWACWSGTSFAAPIVAGVLARRITDGASPAGAVRAVVEDPGLFRLPGLGTVVNVRPW